MIIVEYPGLHFSDAFLQSKNKFFGGPGVITAYYDLDKAYGEIESLFPLTLCKITP